MKKTPDEKKYCHPLKAIFINRFLKEMIESIKKTRAEKVIDIGCGEGYPDKVIGAKLPEIKLVGVDINPDVLERAKKQNPGIKYCQGNIFKLDFRKAEFDLALVMEVLEHLKEPEKAISEIKRVAKKALFSVPWEPWFSLFSLISGHYPKTKGRHPEHLNFWNTDSFGRILKKHYPTVKTKRVFPWLIAVCEQK